MNRKILRAANCETCMVFALGAVASLVLAVFSRPVLVVPAILLGVLAVIVAERPPKTASDLESRRSVHAHVGRAGDRSGQGCPVEQKPFSVTWCQRWVQGGSGEPERCRRRSSLVSAGGKHLPASASCAGNDHAGNDGGVAAPLATGNYVLAMPNDHRRSYDGVAAKADAA